MSEFNVSTTATQQSVSKQITQEFDVLIKDQGYQVPKGFVVANALQGALLMIGQDSKLTQIANSNPDSLKKALFEMIIQGLSPMKKQAYFIPYGNQIQLQRSYFGTQAVLKRLPEIEDIKAKVVHEGEKFVIDYDDHDELSVKEHHTSIDLLDNPIVAVYSVIYTKDGSKRYEVMTKKQIDASWSKSKNKSVQNQFGEEMAKRTIINRAAKNIINTSEASDRLIGSINETTSDEYENDVKDVTPKQSGFNISNIVKNDDKKDVADQAKEAAKKVEVKTENKAKEVVEAKPEVEPEVKPEVEQTEIFKDLANVNSQEQIFDGIKDTGASF